MMSCKFRDSLTPSLLLNTKLPALIRPSCLVSQKSDPSLPYLRDLIYEQPLSLQTGLVLIKISILKFEIKLMLIFNVLRSCSIVIWLKIVLNKWAPNPYYCVYVFRTCVRYYDLFSQNYCNISFKILVLIVKL